MMIERLHLYLSASYLRLLYHQLACKSTSAETNHVILFFIYIPHKVFCTCDIKNVHRM